jgi:hypothetical protein
MTPDERKRIDALAEWVGVWRRMLNDLTEHMGKLASDRHLVSQEAWDRLFQAEENLRKATHAVQKELEEAAQKAGVPGI